MKQLLFSILCITLIGCNTTQQEESNNTETNKANTELTAFNVQETFEKNGFTWFTENLILCSGDTTESNAMTIGWGSIGNYIGHDRPTVTVYVAPARYTYKFMEKYPRFTIMQFDDPAIWKYMGTKSGRDGDKAAALNLHVAYTEHGTPYYEEASMVIECETMTAWHQTEQDFRNNTPKEWYSNFDAGIHTIYIGEIIGAWKR
ncbi:MAG: flavin reductase [Paludibacteraceae bacterium]|nr:flavin reductase [Paludibacteraceae bacterium]MEE3484683.1 flavin reductase family protein [Bacteroidales bacterium]